MKHMSSAIVITVISMNAKHKVDNCPDLTEQGNSPRGTKTTTDTIMAETRTHMTGHQSRQIKKRCVSQG